MKIKLDVFDRESVKANPCVHPDHLKHHPPAYFNILDKSSYGQHFASRLHKNFAGDQVLLDDEIKPAWKMFFYQGFDFVGYSAARLKSGKKVPDTFIIVGETGGTMLGVLWWRGERLILEPVELLAGIPQNWWILETGADGN